MDGSDDLGIDGEIEINEDNGKVAKMESVHFHCHSMWPIVKRLVCVAVADGLESIPA